LQNIIRNDALFKEFSAVLNPIGLVVVDVRRDDHRDETHIVVTVTNNEHTAGINECAKAHRIIFPRISLLEGERNIDLEVSTPGVQRIFRDLYEFSLFAGKRCRIYDSSCSAWVEGIISEDNGSEIVLSKARIEDAKEELEEYHIPYGHVHKAKLAYAWEDM